MPPQPLFIQPYPCISAQVHLSNHNARDQLQSLNQLSLSIQKQEANLVNAQKSTGPKSPEGKSRSAKNATKHGAYALDTLLPNDNPEEYSRFKIEWLKVLSPQNPPELFLAERVASLAWRLQRFAKASTEKHQNHWTLLSPSCKDNNPYYTLAKTEDRLQSMLHRTLKQLQQLQNHQKENPPLPCPYVKEQIPHNEPTEDQAPAPTPTPTEVACVVADEKPQNEPTAATTSTPDTQNPSPQPSLSPPFPPKTPPE